MKTKTLLATVGALALLAAPAVEAQYVPEAIAKGQGVSVTLSGTTAYNPILIRYVGSSPAGGTVAVDAATGDITLKTGPVGSSTADATTECPVSGALGGVIDVSNAACNTLGEVVDAINASANWRAVIQDGVRADSSDNTLTTLAETSASKPEGLALAGDTTVSLQVTALLVPVRNDIRFYVTNGVASLNPNPFSATQSIVWYENQTGTGTGADNKQILFSVPNNQLCSLTASAVVCSASETVSTFSTPGAGSTNNGSLDFTRFGLFSPYKARALVRATFATTFTAVTTFSGAGHVFPFEAARR